MSLRYCAALLSLVLSACSLTLVRPAAGFFALPLPTPSPAWSVGLLDSRDSQPPLPAIDPDDGYRLLDSDFKPLPLLVLQNALAASIESHAESSLVRTALHSKPPRLTRFRAEIFKPKGRYIGSGTLDSGVPPGVALLSHGLNHFFSEAARPTLAVLDVEIELDGMRISASSSEPYEFTKNEVFGQLIRETAKSITAQLAKAAVKPPSEPAQRPG